MTVTITTTRKPRRPPPPPPPKVCQSTNPNRILSTIRCVLAYRHRGPHWNGAAIEWNEQPNPERTQP